jgi:hypothetical protein
MNHELQQDAKSQWCDRCMAMWPLGYDIPGECVPPDAHTRAYIAERAGLASPVPFEMAALSERADLAPAGNDEISLYFADIRDLEEETIEELTAMRREGLVVLEGRGKKARYRLVKPPEVVA